MNIFYITTVNGNITMVIYCIYNTITNITIQINPNITMVMVVLIYSYSWYNGINPNITILILLIYGSKW